MVKYQVLLQVKITGYSEVINLYIYIYIYIHEKTHSVFYSNTLKLIIYMVYV